MDKKRLSAYWASTSSTSLADRLIRRGDRGIKMDMEHLLKGGVIRAGDIRSMNVYMNKVAMAMFSYFDSGKKPSDDAQPERFYHGFVLGLLVDLADRYVVTSNRESGLGRYDVMLKPRYPEDAAVILEFKAREPDGEKTLEDTAREALAQIERQNYKASLEAEGIGMHRIYTYGFAFEGKQVLIREGRVRES